MLPSECCACSWFQKLFCACRQHFKLNSRSSGLNPEEYLTSSTATYSAIAVQALPAPLTYYTCSLLPYCSISHPAQRIALRSDCTLFPGCSTECLINYHAQVAPILACSVLSRSLGHKDCVCNGGPRASGSLQAGTPGHLRSSPGCPRQAPPLQLRPAWARPCLRPAWRPG